jgi:hypothetical protein
MSSLLWHGEQSFVVSNGTKDLLYEVAVEVAKRTDPIARQRLEDDGRLVGCYGVSGMGFELQAFAEAFGGKEAWERATLDNFDVVEEMCGHARCVELMAKLFRWVWFLLDGGRCNRDQGEHPSLEYLPDRPDRDGPART